MSVLGFLLLTLGCVTLCSHIHYEYQLINERKTWEEAQSHCKEKYTDLATIPNLGDMKRLIEMTEASGVTEGIWIGLTNTNKSSWLWADIYRMDHESLEFTGWIRVPHPSHCCGVARCDGNLSGAMCGRNFSYVCQEYQSSKMFFYKNKVMWREALDNCRLENMELASVRSETEKEAFQKILDNEELQTPLWIGLFTDVWIWSDNSESSFRFWEPTEPSGLGGCATFEPTSKAWKINDCTATKPFYCYNGLSKSATRTVRLEIEANSLVNFSDAAVTEAILNQLQNKYSGVKLQWKVQPDGKIFKKKKKDDE